MRLVEKEHCWIYDGIFPEGIVAGFTKPSIDGRSPAEDVLKSLSFLKRKVEVSFMRQVHGAEVKMVEEKGIYVGDGLLTRKAGLVLAVKTADCMPILLHSRAMGIAAAVHMGWRSAKEGILSNLGDDLSSFRSVMGPALRKCCYEVGKEFLDIPGMNPFIQMTGEKCFFDPIDFAGEMMKKKGLKEADLFDPGICSYCSPCDLPSFRRTATKNRTISFIVM